MNESIKNAIQAVRDFQELRMNAPPSNVNRYLASFPQSVGIQNALQVWGHICCRSDFRCIEPDACPGENDNCMLTWSQNEHYLECECLGDGTIEWFYRNRESGEVWGCDRSSHEVTNEIRDKLILFE